MFRYLRWLTRMSYKNHAVYGRDVFAALGLFVLRISLIALIYRAIYTSSWSVGANITWPTVSIALVTRGMIFAQIVNFSAPRVTTEIDTDIKSWKIAVFLLNPMHYPVYKLFEVMWASMFRMMIAIWGGVIVGVMMTQTFFASRWSILLWCVSLCAAIGVTTFGFMMIGMLGFFTEESSSFRWIYSKIAMLFGGIILPLPFMPEWMQQIAFFSPFASSWYTTGLIVQSTNIVQSLQFIGMQVIWMVILWRIVLRIYNKGQSSLLVNGG